MGKLLFFYVRNVLGILIGIALSPLIIIPVLFHFGELSVSSIPMILILSVVSYAFICGVWKSFNEGYVLNIADGFYIPYK